VPAATFVEEFAIAELSLPATVSTAFTAGVVRSTATFRGRFACVRGGFHHAQGSACAVRTSDASHQWMPTSR
jgi:hypothetical protein